MRVEDDGDAKDAGTVKAAKATAEAGGEIKVMRLIVFGFLLNCLHVMEILLSGA